MVWDITQIVLAVLITAFVCWIVIAGMIANVRLRAARAERAERAAAPVAAKKKNMAQRTVSHS